MATQNGIKIMANINQNLIDLSPEALRLHIAAGRRERSLIVHRALGAGLAWLRRPPMRPRLTPAIGRLAGLNA